MLFKGKDQDIETEFEASVDLGYWALPVSICFIPTPIVGCLDGGWALILRVLCFQFSWVIWKWSHETTDTETSFEDLLNGK